MKNIWFLCILNLLFIGCNSSQKKTQLMDYLNNDAAVIIKVKNVGSLKSNISNNAFLKALEVSPSYDRLSEKLNLLHYLKTEDDLYLSLFQIKDSLEFSIVTKLKSDLFLIDSLPNHSIETLKYAKHTITKSAVGKHELFSIVKDSVFIGASTKDLLISSLEDAKIDSKIKALINSSNAENQLSVFINKQKENRLNSFFIDAEISTLTLTDYLFFDMDIEQNALKLNGVIKSADSTKKLIDVFKNTSPQENKLATITPANSDGFLSLTFGDYAVFNKNLNTFRKVDSIQTTTLLDNVIEAGVIYEGSNRAIVLNSLDVFITKDALLNDQDIIENYREIDIYNFSQPELFYNILYPFVTFKEANKYCIVDNFVIFSNDLEMLHTIIASYKNQTTYSSRNHYKTLTDQFSDESSMLSVVNPSYLETIVNRNLKDSLNLILDAFSTTGLQFIYDTDFAHVNAVIQKGKTRAVENAVTEIAAVKIDADILNVPQLVTNHSTSEKEIAVQDIKNNLYLISSTGKILWKKQLQGAILGKIEQIDMFKNGRLQLAFATTNRVYVLDRTGKDVAPFPLKFNDPITQPLSIFDYDGNRKYRIMVTQGKNVLMLDDSGKSVKGFNFSAAADNLIHKPQHIRIGRKDYLLFKTVKKLYILDRVGKTRVTPKGDFNYSDEAVYLFNGNFATTTTNGKLVTIDSKGNTSTKDLGLTDSHHLETTTKTLVALSENRLTIKNNTYELDYGNYSKPNIFYLNDKIYVSVTDKQTQKVYLFDSNAKLMANFPVYGTSAIDMANMDKGRNLEFVTKGDANTVLIYQIN
ncbi:NHL repeat-containing protein [Bizionia myxarmorum]|uniref:Ribonuclease HII n=1 Tax=Bizionia myxarmorum TaxID=291186 RepID=A0A5D0RCY4_9FLAO|nr:ribonuclease HII [Bizionia myxarmorum]TYB79397.1 ribonuclease HII [Bizionia myxarmorum]